MTWSVAAYPLGDDRQHFVGVAIELGGSDPRNGGQVGPVVWPALGDLGQGLVVEHHVGRHAVAGGALPSPLLQPVEQRTATRAHRYRRSRGTLRSGEARLGDPDLLQERARRRPSLLRPGQVQVLARPGDADVEQPAFLVGIGARAGRPEGQFLVEQPGQEHGVPLQPLGAVERQQVHAAPALLRGEPPGRARR